ncbi:MAG: bifunctional hydroxymethylpyrimidine kinase/phosphomethylpyrimidine kinase [Pirellulaceae bacterium]
MTAVALTIAGSDPSGGAGLQADLKTFHQHGVYGMSVVTLLTVQNTQTVSDVRVLDPDFVLAQLDAVVNDIEPQAAKTGALGDASIVAALAECAAVFRFPLVVDPVMMSKHGAMLIDDEAASALAQQLLPHAYLITPNLPEAEFLSGRRSIEDLQAMEEAARAIATMGVPNVLIKGGHLQGAAVDLLWADGEVHRFVGERVATRHTHGTGCVYSAAITAGLAQGHDLVAAVQCAKEFVTLAIQTSPQLGQGLGPTNMLAKRECL